MADSSSGGDRADFRSRLRRERRESDTARGIFGLKLVVFGLQLTMIGLLVSGLLWLVPFGALVSAGGSSSSEKRRRLRRRDGEN